MSLVAGTTLQQRVPGARTLKRALTDPRILSGIGNALFGGDP
jgi:hypothetical protein